MSKKLKKLLALVFAMAMALSLVACGGGDDAGDAETEDTSASETEDAEAEETEDAEAEEAEDAEAEETEDAAAAEGFSLAQLEGITFGIDTMNGKTYEEHCEAMSLDPETSNAFWSIAGEEITIEASGETNTYPLTATDDGFVMNVDGVEIPVTYDAESGTLSYSLSAEQTGGQALDTVMCPYE